LFSAAKKRKLLNDSYEKFMYVFCYISFLLEIQELIVNRIKFYLNPLNNLINENTYDIDYHFSEKIW